MNGGQLSLRNDDDRRFHSKLLLLLLWVTSASMTERRVASTRCVLFQLPGASPAGLWRPIVNAWMTVTGPRYQKGALHQLLGPRAVRVDLCGIKSHQRPHTHLVMCLAFSRLDSEIEDVKANRYYGSPIAAVPSRWSQPNKALGSPPSPFSCISGANHAASAPLRQTQMPTIKTWKSPGPPPLVLPV